MLKRGLALAGVGFSVVLLFQNCGRAGDFSLSITSTPELAKTSPQICSIENLSCSKRRYAPGVPSASERVQECISFAGQELCLGLDFQSYNSADSSTEKNPRLEYSCWVGPRPQAAAYALRDNLTQAVNASLAACQEGVSP